MAMTGISTVLKRSTDNGNTWTTIAAIKSIDGPGMARDEVETTTLDNQDGYRTFIGGLRDGGSLTLTILYKKDTYSDMVAAYNSDDTDKWQIELPDGGKFEFDGWVKEVPLSISVDDAVSYTVTIRVVGKPVFTA